MKIDWDPLRAEIEKCHRKELTLPLWWRDDDAVDDSEALDRLIGLSKEVRVPVHLAIIPRNATVKLAQRISDEPLVFPVVHGWAHRNNAATGNTRSEFSDARSLKENREEAEEGLRKLKRLLPAKVLPVFVPPWNHIDPKIASELSEIGYEVLSTCDARVATEVFAGLKQVNSHLDPIAWRADDSLRDIDELMTKLITCLKRRRQGKDDNSEPFGFLTHHLSMNDEVWEFTRQFWQEILKAPHEIVKIA